MNNIEKNRHLCARAGFGLNFSEIDLYKRTSHEKLYSLLSQYSYTPLPIEGFPTSFREYPDKDSFNDRKAMNQYFRNYNLTIANTWQKKMTESPGQLQEKMALFWHGHFATRVRHPLFNLNIVEIFRKHGLGNFRELLMEVSQSPAMLQFLNNQQNKKQHPNENFARELMELFTLGRGNYTEKDIRESARAFTGWSFDKSGQFRMNYRQHDEGEKNFLGKTGNFTGADIINIILDLPQCARFITGKIFRFFVNEQADEEIINQLSAKFYASNYNIGKLMDEIFLSDWFYAEKNIGAKIKSPVELITGICRAMPFESRNENMVYNFQRLLGQALLQPPNVAGWPSGTSWIDSSTLLLRMRIPEILAGYRSLDIEPKPDDDLNMGQREKEIIINRMKGQSTILWEKITPALNEDLFALLLPRSSEELKNLLLSFNAGKSRQHLLVSILCTPDYQLC
ncbi:MAG: DUF1800 domain-containing protein [Chitinophagaceae bacterium]|nr:DUF1800 domain-containing protein [Bacteroidota bacterium]MCC6257108.1 DUF1800 domain-containing protein [Chitinophagaceae bacterium]MCW5916378.1 DUF1800 domain-containing protein [Ferruginibacter sp.]